MKLNLLTEKLLDDLNQIKRGDAKIITQANRSIILCRKLLAIFKKEIVSNDFNSIEDEIDFFKNTKQVPLTQLIYFSEIRLFEMHFPKANIEIQRKFIKKKLNELNTFFLYNIDFGQYIESGYTHFDKQYFTREFLDNFPITSSKFYFQDPEFSTPKDMLLGEFKAYGQFILYLQNRLIGKATSRKENNLDPNNHISLQWTSSKVALTELIYALHHNRVINNGNTDIKEIALALQQLLNFDLGEFYKTFAEIKSRKLSRTKFLDELAAGLQAQMDSSDE